MNDYTRNPRSQGKRNCNNASNTVSDTSSVSNVKNKYFPKQSNSGASLKSTAVKGSAAAMSTATKAGIGAANTGAEITMGYAAAISSTDEDIGEYAAEASFEIEKKSSDGIYNVGSAAAKYTIKQITKVPNTKNRIAEEKYRQAITRNFKRKIKAPVSNARNALNNSAVGTSINSAGTTVKSAVSSSIRNFSVPITQGAGKVNSFGDRIKDTLDETRAEARAAMKGLGKRVYKKSYGVHKIHRNYKIANKRLQKILSSKQIVLAKRATGKVFKITSVSVGAAKSASDGVVNLASRSMAADIRFKANQNVGDALAERYQSAILDAAGTSGGLVAKESGKAGFAVVKQFTPTQMYKNYQNATVAAHRLRASTVRVRKIASSSRKNIKAAVDAAKTAKQAYAKTQQAKIYIKANMEIIKQFGVSAIRIGRAVIQVMQVIIRYIADTFAVIIAAGGGFMAVTVVVIVIILCIICGLFSWVDTNPLNYTNYINGDDATLSQNTYDIINSYITGVKDCVDWEQAYFYYIMGDYCSAYFMWGPATFEAVGGDEYIAAKIDQWVENNPMPEPPTPPSPTWTGIPSDDELAAYSAMVSEFMSSAYPAYQAELAAWQRQYDGLYDLYYDEVMDSLDSLNDQNVLSYEQIQRLRRGTIVMRGRDYIDDSEQYTGNPVFGTNQFDNYVIDTELTAEDLVALIAVADYVKKTTDKDYENPVITDENGKELSSWCITTEDISEFFEVTEFVQYESDLTKGECNGNCQRLLKGTLLTGCSWEYYCDGEHDVLSGSVVSVRSVDECLSAIAIAYDKDYLTRTSQEIKNETEMWKTIYEAYKDYILSVMKDGVAEGETYSEHKIGGASLEAYLYYLSLVENETAAEVEPEPWKFNIELEHTYGTVKSIYENEGE